MKVLLLVNPFSSSVTARTRVLIRKALAGAHDVELVETARRNHATRLAQGAAAEGVDVVIVLGGDGTVNEAANGLAGTGTALGVLPGGSTNVFARSIGLPNDPIEATTRLLEAMAAGSIERVGSAPPTAGTSASTWGSATTPPSSSRWSGARASSGGPATPCSSTPG
ncbi:diacylglycerol/lipid kinase family protein [Aquihabitans daechungensis]|uniref:diacylglycerol/lipid kinase family protein n=1 Tax=Aquihabitans daechungensis TaxID=1052257 RepID=UPI003BA3CA15